MGDTDKPVIPEMLKAVVQTAEPDRLGRSHSTGAHGEPAAVLFKGLLRINIQGIEPGLLYLALCAIAKNVNRMARATLTCTITETP